MRKYIFILLALAALDVSAQSKPTLRLSLSDCLKLAEGHNLSVKSAQASIGESKIMESSYLDLPQTDITLVQATTDGGGPDNGLKFSQEFDFPTVYIAKRKYLQSETELVRKQADVARNDMAMEVSSLYYSLVYQREIGSLLLSQDSIYSEFCRIAQARLDAGETSRLEVLNARRLYNENRLAIDNNKQDYTSLLLRFRNLLNVDFPVEPLEQELSLIDAFLPADTLSFMSTPAGIVADSRLEMARRNRHLAQQGFLPKFNVGATAQLLISGFNPYNVDRTRFEKGNFMGFEVGVSVPLFFGAQKAKVKAANKAIEAEQYRIEEESNRQLTEYRILCDDYAAVVRTLSYYRATGLPEAREMARLSRVSYRYGEIGYEELIRNLESYYAVKKAYADAIENYNQIVIKLKHIKGEL